jgi:hypothetical protein
MTIAPPEPDRPRISTALRTAFMLEIDEHHGGGFLLSEHLMEK